MFFNYLICAGLDRISLGTEHSLILQQDGSVWAVGGNQFGQLGTYSVANSTDKFVEVLSGGVKAVTAGSEYSMVLKQDGSVWATGKNQHGQLGDGTNTDKDSFVEVISNGVKAMATGLRHSLVVQEDGSIWTTGHNNHGQLGDGTTADRMTFVRVRFIDENAANMWTARGNALSHLRGAQAVAAGVDHSMVLRRDGSVWAAGGNNYGQIGDASTTSKASFVQILPAGVKAIAAGGYHSIVLKKDGTVWATGGNDYGQLGDGSMMSKKIMHLIAVRSVQSVNGVEAKAIAAGFLHSMVLFENGRVWVSGSNYLGQLGAGSIVRPKSLIMYVPVVAGGARAIAAGYFHSMILKRDGSFWATGSNSAGQLGDGSMTTKDTFIRVARANDRGAWYIPRCVAQSDPVLS